MSAVAANAPARPARKRSRGKVRLDALLLPLVVLAILALWEGAVAVTGISKVVLPRPSSIAVALVQGFSNPITSRASYFPHIQQTVGELLAGYAVGSAVGLALAVVSVRTPLLERLLRPLVVAFQSVPKIALAPLIVVWFGFGFNSKFVLIILATFFPLFVNGITGFKSVEENRINLMRAFGASRWQVFTKVTFPTALPFIFAGLEIALVHAVTSAIVAEFLGGQKGLGVMILQMEQLLDVAGIFSVLIILAVIGWLLNAMLGLARRRVVFWAPEANASATN
jgi:NitT/TauT family transport system permease protein